MSEQAASGGAASAPAPLGPGEGVRTAGQMLRQARQAQGLHVSALASAIKVTPQKLEALENERFEDLPDPTFARALALAVCRYLKIDPAPVLARLPQPREHRLEHIHRGLATTFRERPGRGHDGGDSQRILKPALLGPLFVLVAALVVYMVPVEMWHLPSFENSPPSSSTAPASSPETAVAAAEPAPAQAVVASVTANAASASPASIGAAPAAVASMPAAAASVVASAQPAVAAATAKPPASAVGALVTSAASSSANGPLAIKALKDTWVEVTEAGGRVLLSRTLTAGESVGVDGEAPLKVRIGNAIDTQVTYRGEAVPLAPVTQNNIARLELK